MSTFIMKTTISLTALLDEANRRCRKAMSELERQEADARDEHIVVDEAGMASVASSAMRGSTLTAEIRNGMVARLAAIDGQAPSMAYDAAIKGAIERTSELRVLAALVDLERKKGPGNSDTAVSAIVRWAHNRTDDDGIVALEATRIAAERAAEPPKQDWRIGAGY